MSATLPPPIELCFAAARELGLGARLLDREHGYLWELSDGRGFRRAIVGSKLPVNDACADRLAQDKHYTQIVLEDFGYRVPRSVRLLCPRHWRQPEFAAELEAQRGLAPARDLAAELGFPLVVKPNALSHGRQVTLVEDFAALEAAVAEVFRWDTIALLQERIRGREFRLDFLGERYLIGYERRPLRLIGDGRRCLGELLLAADPRLAPGALLDELRAGATWRRALAAAGGPDVGPEELAWTPKSGSQLELSSEIMNLNRGASAVFLPEIPEAWRRWSVELGRRLGLEHFGLDLRAESLDAEPESACVLEVNATPLVVQMARLGHRREALDAWCAVMRRAVEKAGAWAPEPAGP
jgi:glutathione synthase/RimK-type ligase-like ATP-grasp enzyme